MPMGVPHGFISSLNDYTQKKSPEMGVFYLNKYIPLRKSLTCLTQTEKTL